MLSMSAVIGSHLVPAYLRVWYNGYAYCSGCLGGFTRSVGSANIHGNAGGQIRLADIAI